MDPVSAIGLAAGVAQLIGMMASLITFINDVKDAPNDRARLALETASLLTFLTDFRYGIEKSDLKDKWFSSVRLLVEEGGPLESFADDIKTLLSKLRPSGGAGKLVKAITWPMERSDVDKIISRMERLKTLISLSRQEDHFRLSLGVNSNLTELRGFLEMEQKERERQGVLDWISSLPQKQTDYFARCHRGTGEWFLRSDTFKAWVAGISRTLWCYGQPSKQALAKQFLRMLITRNISLLFTDPPRELTRSLVVNELEQHLDRDSAVASIYCNFKEQGPGTAELLVASLLRQLVVKDREIHPDIISLRARHRGRSTRPSLADWSRLLQLEVRRFSKTFVIIDALDECSENDGTRDSFMTEIRSLQPFLHLLITSRNIASIENELGKGMCMEIRASDHDVGQYLKGRIQKEGRLSRLLRADQDLQETITRSIVNNAKGMFLLAQLQMDSVAKKNNRRDIRRSLANLPTALNDTYDEAMRRIWSQSEEDVKLAERLLLWIIHAYRPLKLAEIQHVLAVENGDSNLDEDGIPEEDIIVSACAGLVTVDQESNTIRLVHYTAQEYFEYARMTRFPYAQAKIAATCLTYLSFDNFNNSGSSGEGVENLFQTYPLAAYAAQYWGDHARGDPEEVIEELALAFLRQVPKVAISYQMMNRAAHGFVAGPTSQEVVTGLHIASQFGLARIVRTLLILGDVDPNARDLNKETPLSWAASRGHEDVVRQLLEHQGIKADTRNMLGRTPLALAATGGHTAVVRLLLEAGDVEPNTKDTYYGQTPLWQAADRGHKGVVELLLGHHGINVNARDKHFGHTPLWRAAENGHDEVVKLLLQRLDVDVNAKSKHGQTALDRAIENQHDSTARLLLQDPRIDCGSRYLLPSKSPMIRVAERNQQSLVRLLSYSGSTVNTF